MVNNIDPMVSNSYPRVSPWIARLVAVYVAAVVVAILVLVALTFLAPAQATDEAWWHAMIVAVFAVLLPLRTRAAVRGNAHAYGAVGVIAAVLAIVNVIEALIPGFVPLWMRIEMFGIAALMAVIAALVWRDRATWSEA
ncbi:hypothetical protein [Rothia koreensis]|uniref:hypothetical protein n=1 Tax=Rothia koreensis TaxID=592378 RepID=UPI003FCDAAAE